MFISLLTQVPTFLFKNVHLYFISSLILQVLLLAHYFTKRNTRLIQRFVSPYKDQIKSQIVLAESTLQNLMFPVSLPDQDSLFKQKVRSFKIFPNPGLTNKLFP